MNAIAGSARSEVAAQFLEVLRKCVSTAAEVPAQGAGRALVAAGSAAEAQIDPPREERFQRAELFGDDQR